MSVANESMLHDAIQDAVFKYRDNYLVVDTPKEGAEKICAIYFTSGAVYFPKTSKGIAGRIVYGDKYEWFATRIPNASRHIFVRDVRFKWYLEGLNAELDSVDKLLEFFREQTQGYEVITVGSSLGGFAALLYGKFLKAKRIYAFSPCVDFSIYKTLKGKYPEWSNLRPRFIDNEIPVYCYLASKNVKIDVPQIPIATSIKNFHCLLHAHEEHGVNFSRRVLRKVFAMSDAELQRIYCGKELTHADLAKAFGYTENDVIDREEPLKWYQFGTEIKRRIVKHLQKDLKRG